MKHLVLQNSFIDLTSEEPNATQNTDDSIFIPSPGDDDTFCPEVVSLADFVNEETKNVLSFVKGVHFFVPQAFRDGWVLGKSEAATGYIPSPFFQLLPYNPPVQGWPSAKSEQPAAAHPVSTPAATPTEAPVVAVEPAPAAGVAEPKPAEQSTPVQPKSEPAADVSTTTTTSEPAVVEITPQFISTADAKPVETASTNPAPASTEIQPSSVVTLPDGTTQNITLMSATPASEASSPKTTTPPLINPQTATPSGSSETESHADAAAAATSGGVTKLWINVDTTVCGSNFAMSD